MAYKVLDVSKFNPIQDYAAAAADDLDGVIMRIGYRGYGSSGSLNTDDLYILIRITTEEQTDYLLLLVLII